MNWSDITLEQYIELNQTTDPFDIIGIILNKDSVEIDNMPYDELLKLLPQTDFIKTAPPRQNTAIIIEDIRYDIIDFQQLEIGAYIDIEHYLFEKEKITDNLDIILAILYRRIIKQDILGHIKYEKYDGSKIKILGKYMMQLKMDKIFHILGDYIKWRDNIKNTYHGLFDSDNSISKEEEAEMLANMTTRERLEYEGGKKIGKWGWVVMLYKLADRNPLKINKAAKLSVIAAFNLLSMMQELKINEQETIK
jgi:hypothetical protein